MALLSSCSRSIFLIPLFIIILSSPSQGQSISVGDNAYESLDLLGCKQFKLMIVGANLVQKYKSSMQTLTLFAFNDTTYDLYRSVLNFDAVSNTEASKNSKADYIQAFTLSKALEAKSFSAASPQSTNSLIGLKVFLNQKKLRFGNTASGSVGPTQYFCNGARVTQANIQAGLHVIHIIDLVLPMPIESRVLGYISGRYKRTYQFYEVFMKFLDSSGADDSVFNYNKQISEPLSEGQVTFFIPSDEAVSKIPGPQIASLKRNTKKLLEIIALHIIPKAAVYTSLVNHNELYRTQMEGNLVFRKNFNKEAVYVTGTRKGGDTVTARVYPANVTVENGVIHQVDRILGFVYKSAYEEIATEQLLNNFEGFVTAGRSTIQQALSNPNLVTVFAPTNNAIQAIANRYPEYNTNQTLINRVLELSILKPGTPFALTGLDGGYMSMTVKETIYHGRMIKVYSQGNDTWVEGGYVRAKVIKPDIGVTNGFVHMIDAVFGVPTRDMTYTIYCDDRLVRTYEQLAHVGLDKYMVDTNLVKNQQCSFRDGEGAGSAGVPNWRPNEDKSQTGNDRYADYRKLCGRGSYACQFTFFVPNGTAIETFAASSYGRDVLNDTPRWRWILRRLMSSREVIYIDKIPLGAPRRFVADNGEEVIIQVNSQGNLPSSQRFAHIMFEGVKAEIMHSDIGATNGVIHIIKSVIFTQDDISRDVSGSKITHISVVVFLLALSITRFVSFWDDL